MLLSLTGVYGVLEVDDEGETEEGRMGDLKGNAALGVERRRL